MAAKNCLEQRLHPESTGEHRRTVRRAAGIGERRQVELLSLRITPRPKASEPRD
jgi:hypothetical protein